MGIRHSGYILLWNDRPKRASRLGPDIASPKQRLQGTRYPVMALGPMATLLVPDKMHGRFDVDTPEI
jgi:hypothetical protein